MPIAQAERYSKLFESGIVSKEQYDTFRTNSDALAASLRADKAEIERAKIDLDYCTIRSPMDGRTGSLLVNSGNIVKSNETVLVVINQIGPIYVSFTVPEQHLAEISAVCRGRPLAVVATIPNDRSACMRASLTFVETIGGYDHRHDPTERLPSPIRTPALARPVCERRPEPEHTGGRHCRPLAGRPDGQSGFYAYVVKSDLKAELRPIVPGSQVGGEVRHRKGASTGRIVVTDGQLRLSPGAKVEVKEAASTGSQEQQSMNLAELFIRRPVMTTLVMLGDPAVRHHGLPLLAGQRPAQRRFPDHPGERGAARRQPGNDGLVGGDAAGAAVLDHRRPRLDDVDAARSGGTQITLQFNLSRNIDAAAQDVQAAIAQAAGPASARHALAADLPEGESRRSAHPLPGASGRTRCRSPRWTSTPTR